MHALLTLDLPRATSEQRKKFNEQLAKDNWTKLREDTVWTANFRPNRTEVGIVTATKNYVAAAAKVGGVTEYRCVVAVSVSSPTSFSV